MRGMAIDTRRSKNSQARSPRRVTLAPISWPSRSLNEAIDFLARVTTGFWPAMISRSRMAPSMRDFCWVARPTPILMTIFVRRGTSMMLDRPRVSWSSVRTLSS